MSLGALTTTYTPPASCTVSLGHTYVLDDPQPTIVGPVSTDGCFPDNYGDSRDNYYSPGICPAGYTSACSSFNSGGGTTETVVTCCPTSFTCNNYPQFSWESSMGCSSTVSGLETIVVTVLASDGEAISTYTNSIAQDGGLNAFSYQIRFQSTDFQPTGQSHTQTSSQTASPASSSTGVSATDGANAGSPGGNSGLPPATAAGIGVGAAIAVILLVAGVWLAFRMGRRREQRKLGLRGGGPYAIQEMESKPGPYAVSASNVDPYEVPADHRWQGPPLELDAQNRR